MIGTKIVQFHETGGPEVLRLEPVDMPEPKAGEIRFRVHAIGLNRAEVMWRQGSYLIETNLPARIGMEGAGVVDAVGAGVDQSLLGQRISNLPTFSPRDYGVYGEHAIIPAASAMPIPASLSFAQATAVWVPYLTAYGALVHQGALKAGDTLLVTAASSSTGLAAIQIAKDCGARVIAVTRTQAKAVALARSGADHLVVTDEEDLVDRVTAITDGEGARLIYDPVGGPGVEPLAACAAVGGILFEYGLLSAEPTPYPLFTALSRQLTIKAYDAVPEVFQAPAVLRAGLEWLVPRLEDGRFVPSVDPNRFSLDQIVDAHRFMESNEQTGKIVIDVLADARANTSA